MTNNHDKWIWKDSNHLSTDNDNNEQLQIFLALIKQFENNTGVTYLPNTIHTLSHAFLLAYKADQQQAIIIFLQQIHNYPPREQQLFSKFFLKATHQPQWTPNIQDAKKGPKTGYHLFIGTVLRHANQQWKTLDTQQKLVWNQTANNQ